MKKYIIPLLASLVLLTTSTAFAQTTLASAGHTVEVRLPEVAFLRFTPDVASRGVYTGPLDLVFAPDVNAVQAGTPIARTNTAADWGDLKVFLNRDVAWTVSVSTTQNSGPETFDWSQIATTGFNIGNDQIQSGNTRGWHSLGFGAADFRLTLDGTELAGNYVATVTYTLTTP